MLLHLYHTTGGASWSSQDGWAEDEDDLGRWFGVTANAGGRVVKLELKGETAVDGTSAGDINGKSRKWIHAMQYSVYEDSHHSPTVWTALVGCCLQLSSGG